MSDKDEFYKWMESDEEHELWSGNYNNATRDEYVAKRAWYHQQKKIDKLEEECVELLNVIIEVDKRHVWKKHEEAKEILEKLKDRYIKKAEEDFSNK